MGKVHANLSIDSDVFDYCKAKGINMSQEAENYFKSLMGLDPRSKIPTNYAKVIENLEADLAKAKVGQAREDAIKQADLNMHLEEQFQTDRQALIKMYVHKEDSLMQKEQFENFLMKFMQDYRLTRGQAVELILRR